MKKQKKDQNWTEELLKARLLAQMSREEIRAARDSELLWQKIEYHSHPQNMTFRELINVDDL